MSLGKYLALDKVANFFGAIKQAGGIRGTVYKLFRQDDVKAGVLVGEDKHGNKYYENPSFFYGRNRWVEYNDNTYLNYDASQVEERDGNTKKIKTKDTEDFEITNSTWKLQRKRKKRDKEEQYADYFVKKAVLTNGGRRLEKTENSASESEDDDGVKKDVFNMTDEELFAACGGRTAHKGARHGLKATGKLARIAQQEHMLLTQSQYEGYSHAKRRKAEALSKTQEDNENETISSNNKQKKKKKKTEQAETEVLSLPMDCEKSNSDSVASDSEKNENSRKFKKLKKETLVVSEDDTSSAKKKKKKHKLEEIKSEGNIKPVEINVEDEVKEETVKKLKKKKLKSVDVVNE